jgi:hypothetical protein
LSALATLLVVGQSAAASLSGEVRDLSGARISGVAIAVIAADGKVKFTVSDRVGRYLITDLQPGRYTVWAWSKGFALYENNSLLVRRGRDSTFDIPLEVGMREPWAPGRELSRIAYEPARNLWQGDKPDMGCARAGVLATGLSTDFQLSYGSDSVAGRLGKGACP